MESRKHTKHETEDSSLETEARLDRIAEMIRQLPPDRLEQLEKTVSTMSKGRSRLVPIREAALMLDCSVDTVKRMIRSGNIKAVQLTTAGNWKIAIEELERFMRGER